jgi:hypothetical protein
MAYFIITSMAYYQIYIKVSKDELQSIIVQLSVNMIYFFKLLKKREPWQFSRKKPQIEVPWAAAVQLIASQYSSWGRILAKTLA